jgi:hypothetical protein
MDIHIAARPRAVEGPEGEGIAICIPLTSPADELLVEALEHSPQIASFCDRLEPRGEELIVYPKDAGSGGLGTMLTAIQSLLVLTNDERATQAMSDEEMQAKAVEAEKREVEGELRAWWDQRT